jgi:hypothetical protein
MARPLILVGTKTGAFIIDGEKADLASLVPPGSEVFITTAISGGEWSDPYASYM